MTIPFRIISLTLIGTGVLLILCSPLWVRIASSSLFWKKEAAQEYSAAVANMHYANVEAIRNPVNAKSAAVAQETFRQQQVRVARARQFRDQGGPIMRTLGGIMAVLGIGTYWATRPPPDP